MTLPGPNQTHCADRRPLDRPAPRKPWAITAAAFGINPAERDHGYTDGFEGARWDIGCSDPLSYGTGYIIGVEDRRRKARENSNAL